jgi:D-aminopeptidase
MDAGKTLREHGLRIGELEPGATASIADVDGVAVGHGTVGCTGVTAVLPGPVDGLWAEPVPAGVAVLNGAGELTGFLQISEWGVFETPVYLTATMSVGRVYDAAVAAAMVAEPRVGVEAVVIPVVGECDDSWLNDPRAAQVEAEHVQRALADASGSRAVEQGAVGAGAGMVCFGWKGGTGSSSRVTGAGHTVGVLVLANYGDSPDLRIDGVPVGRELAAPPSLDRDPAGSCIAVVATDAPLGSAQLSRVARRAGLGLARTGSVAHHGSGEIFVAFSTTARAPRGEPAPPALPDGELDPLFLATVDATEEAVLNALWAAETTSGRDGRVFERLPHEPVLELLARQGRLGG